MTFARRCEPSNFVLRTVRNFTTPLRVAYNVSSAPRRTLIPGKNRVPLWRMRIIPDFTICPPNFLTPNRFDRESRPNLLVPADFVFDIRSIYSYER